MPVLIGKSRETCWSNGSSRRNVASANSPRGQSDAAAAGTAVGQRSLAINSPNLPESETSPQYILAATKMARIMTINADLKENRVGSTSLAEESLAAESNLRISAIDILRASRARCGIACFSFLIIQSTKPIFILGLFITGQRASSMMGFNLTSIRSFPRKYLGNALFVLLIL